VTLALARATDELRRGRPVGVSGLGVLAVELADDATLAAFEAGSPADLLIAHPRAVLLKLANQRAAATPQPVRIQREPWHDLPALLAIADPVSDMTTPMKGPFRSVPLAEPEAAAAAIRLAKRAGLLPALLTVDRIDPDWLTVAATDVLAAREATSLRLVTRARLPLDGAPDTQVVAFRSDDGGPEHLALLIGDSGDTPLVRLHSACLTGDVLGSLKCDCGPQLRAAIAEIAAAGGGIVLYLQQEGRGIGLLNKLRAYALQDQGFDTVDANLRLGFEVDERDFGLAAAMLRLLGIARIRLLTNNPAKVGGLESEGITVAARVPLKVGEGAHNAAYLATKRDRTGHLL
jgi:GTP cyclohydrolase II